MQQKPERVERERERDRYCVPLWGGSTSGSHTHCKQAGEREIAPGPLNESSPHFTLEEERERERPLRCVEEEEEEEDEEFENDLTLVQLQDASVATPACALPSLEV